MTTATPEQTRRPELLKDTVTAIAVIAITASVYGQLFNRESVLSYSIGYNLYSAERLLAGDVPYRDFHTLYPPATLYLNAALFKAFGVSLYTALFGVFVFKALTVLFIYLNGRALLPRRWAVAVAAVSLVWLRPNGPFKAVPMHYGALFLALAVWLLLRARWPRRYAWLFAAGCALGLLATFKHNIGAYALAGSLIVAMLDDEKITLRPSGLLKHLDRAGLLIAGFLLPVVPMLIYMKSQHALGAMTRALLFGPGEFLLNRLAAVPSPDVPLVYLVGLTAVALIAGKLEGKQATALWAIAVLGSVGMFAFGPQAAIDKLIFYAPALIIIGAFTAFVFARDVAANERRALLAVTVAAAAAFMESFPRFAREQAIASMPFVILLSVVLVFRLRPFLAINKRIYVPFAPAMTILVMALALMGGRLFVGTYFERAFRLRSDTALEIERGRGVYFPKDQAGEIEQVVAAIEQRVPPGGYFFPQSYAGSSYLFLADRRNPSGAQFWGGVGVTAAERARTLDALDTENVDLILTSVKDMAAERYEPMRDYIDRYFHPTASFGEVVFLKRVKPSP